MTYVVEHEFDHEPTYVSVHGSDEPTITFTTEAPLQFRLLAAKIMCELLEHWPRNKSTMQKFLDELRL